VPEFVDVVEMGVEAAVAIGCVAAATSATMPSVAAGAGMFTVVGPATLRVTLWPSRVDACGTTASTSARAASTSADTSMPTGPAARAVPGHASPLQTIAPATTHARASQGTRRPEAPGRSKRMVSWFFSMPRSVAGDELPEES
jgi:hypothetical protein